MNKITVLHDFLRAARKNLLAIEHAQPEHVTYEEKKYSRMKKISLSTSEETMSLQEIFDKRVSAESFEPGSTITRSELSGLLSGLKVLSEGHRPYPSGGALFPIETYVINRTMRDIPSSVMHYNPIRHELDLLWDFPRDFDFEQSLYGHSSARYASCAIVFTGIWHRVAQKYQDFGYLLALLEAGHAAQNVLLSAAALGISARPIAGFEDIVISRALDLDESREQPIYVVGIGGKK
jgi:SagB-type dehydrogenase family enzyme